MNEKLKILFNVHTYSMKPLSLHAKYMLSSIPTTNINCVLCVTPSLRIYSSTHHVPARVPPIWERNGGAISPTLTLTFVPNFVAYRKMNYFLHCWAAILLHLPSSIHSAWKTSGFCVTRQPLIIEPWIPYSMFRFTWSPPV